MNQIISSVSVLGQNYQISDNFAREQISSFETRLQNIESKINTLKSAAFVDTIDTVSEPTTNKIPTDTAIKKYLDSNIERLNAFDIIIPKDDKLPTPSQSTMYKIYLIKDPRPTSNQQYVEWITISTAPNQYSWEKVGNTKLF